ncbi:hypothetical protein ASE75_12495 [Sphingomonas sp. Leaf17]|nr:hypothetical protein ASE75_12495 [Sphingomonas sp. Leaf17]
MPDAVRRVVIVGGGTTGWSAAAALATAPGMGHLHVTLVETPDIPTIGVGEATIPHIRGFNAAIGLDEARFVANTGATIKLGIRFDDWHRRGARYFHPFGETVRRIGGVDPHHHLVRGQMTADDLAALSPGAVAAATGRVVDASPPDPAMVERADYAYHFDAGRYAPLLRDHAVARGVVRVTGRVAGIRRAPADGMVEAVLCDDGRAIAGDLFLDCSGFRGLLIGDAPDNRFVDWSHWLPCDRAVAAPCARLGELVPFTRSTADVAGWRWRIPLQHRTGNGHVYCSAFLDDTAAADALLAAMDGPPLADPRVIPFRTGHRDRVWDGNVVALGLAAGFLEPLESTSIYLAQKGALLLLDLFPGRQGAGPLRDEYNRVMLDEFAQIRDFLVLHYSATTRDDSAFWRARRGMPPPDSLSARLALFENHGVLWQHQRFFNEVSWRAVLIGQGIVPRGHDPRLDAVPEDWARSAIAAARAATRDWVARYAGHAETVAAIVGAAR